MLILAAILSISNSVGTPFLPCKDISSNRFINKIVDLPPEVRSDLIARIPDLVDSGEDFQRTDSADLGKKRASHHRFLSATLIKDEWFVSFESGAPYGVNTVGYVRLNNGPKYQIWLQHNFNGPPCVAIEAALNGVNSANIFR